MNFRDKLKETNGNTAALYKSAPETMQAFQAITRTVGRDGALSKKTKELTALAIAVYARCEGCIVFHINAAIGHGVSREELSETLTVAVEMGGGPAVVYAGIALAAFDELTS